jgi:hypothetical protein
MQRRKSGITNLEIPLMRIQAVRQATLEVTGSSLVRVHIDPAVWYIAVGLGHPGRVGAAKGWVVHPLKSHMSWVQYVARQYGSISWEWCLLRETIFEYERNGDRAPLVDRL